MREDAAKTMQLARETQAAWARASVRERGKRLSALRHLIAHRMDAIIATLTAETGKTPMDALSGDVLVALEQMRYYERHAGKLLGKRRVGQPAFLYNGAKFTERREPHGVALIYGPSNYPFQLAVVPMATALFAGNAVVLKCSEKTPATAALISELCRDAGLPEGLAQVVWDAPVDAGAWIDAGPDVVFFTGSSANGRTVAKRAAEKLIPVVLELGGKDAALVFADCNLERTVEGVAYGAFANAGQVCVGIKRLYVERAIFAELVNRLAQRAQDLRVGVDVESDTGALHFPADRARFARQVEDAIRRGARVHTPRAWVEGMNAMAPAILSGVPEDASLLLEDTFGPVVCVASFENEREAVALANGSAFALSASIWTGDAARGERVAAQLHAGSVAVNDVIRNIANPYASFGGNGMSGYGRYHGPEGLYAFSRTKSVMTMGDARRREIHWFPTATKTYKLLRKLMRFRHEEGSWMKRLRTLLLVGLMLGFVLPGFAAENGREGRLTIEVKLLPKSHGSIAYLVFKSPDGFPGNTAKSLRHGFSGEPQPGQTMMTIDAGLLPPGRYAVSVYQDVNGDRKLDHNFLGIPNEPVGASENPKGRMGPPRFNDCAFAMGKADKMIEINLVH